MARHKLNTRITQPSGFYYFYPFTVWYSIRFNIYFMTKDGLSIKKRKLLPYANESLKSEQSIQTDRQRYRASSVKSTSVFCLSRACADQAVKDVERMYTYEKVLQCAEYTYLALATSSHNIRSVLGRQQTV